MDRYTTEFFYKQETSHADFLEHSFLTALLLTGSNHCTHQKAFARTEIALLLHPSGQRPTITYLHSSINIFWDMNPVL